MKIPSIILSLFLELSIISCHVGSLPVKLNPQVTLGHFLFFEKKLSFNNSKSCASCHSPELAFTDGYRRSVAANGENLLHNAPSLLNLSNNYFFDWDNPTIKSLERQIKRPLYNKHPIELGLDLDTTTFFSFLETDSLYRNLFQNAYPHQKNRYSTANIEECIVKYIMNLNTLNSKYDKYIKGQKTALNESEINGMSLFFSDKLKCRQCHAPPLFTNANLSNDMDSVYANIGLYNLKNENRYPENDYGLAKNTRKTNDDGKFKIPSLRNVMLTAPYMHDGSVSNISEVIEIYVHAGRSAEFRSFGGDGRFNKNKHPSIRGFSISQNDKIDLINFLSSLTDTSYLTNAFFLNPFRIK